MTIVRLVSVSSVDDSQSDGDSFCSVHLAFHSAPVVHAGKAFSRITSHCLGANVGSNASFTSGNASVGSSVLSVALVPFRHDSTDVRVEVSTDVYPTSLNLIPLTNTSKTNASNRCTDLCFTFLLHS
jgi:hypothetical protein